MTRGIAAFTILLGAGAPWTARAQTPGDSAVARTSVGWKRQAPPTSPLLAPASSVTLEGTFGDKVAKARYAISKDPFTLGFSLEGPIDKGNATTILADLDGLRGATTASIDFDVTLWNPTFPSNAALRALYERATGRPLVVTPTGPTISLAALADSLGEDLLRLINVGTPVFLGGRFTFGRQAFEFVDTVSLAGGKRNEDVIGFRATIGVLTRSNWLLFGEAGFDRIAKAGPPRDLCRPATGGASVCEAVTWGGPKTSTPAKATIGARHAFTAGFGIAPQLAWDFSKDRGALELPLYLLTGQGGGLTGGVSVGVETENGTPFLRVFVGPTLSLKP